MTANVSTRTLVGCCAALILAGCAPTFTRADGSVDSQMAADHFECSRLSMVSGPSGTVVVYPLLRQCMAARGYK